jgi:hypothetical protein
VPVVPLYAWGENDLYYTLDNPTAKRFQVTHTLKQILDRSTVEIKEFQADPSFQGGRDREGGRKSRHFDRRVYVAVSVSVRRFT